MALFFRIEVRTIKQTIYLDYAATTPLSCYTMNYITELLGDFGNPSSTHSLGIKAKTIMENTREAIADFIHARKEDIFFTPGGSGSNTLAIKGYASTHSCTIFYSPIAHSSILECVQHIPDAYPLKVDAYGRIDLTDFKHQISSAPHSPFVIVDYANSEIGTVQDIKELITITHQYKGILYGDCTGSIASLPLDVTKECLDMCGFSAHKLGGLKGCGVLYKRKEIELEPLIYGTQESGLIGGTENVIGIASLYAALKIFDYSSITSSSRDYVSSYIKEHLKRSYLVGSKSHHLPLHLCVCFPEIEGESLMMLLDEANIQVSTGSACNSGSLLASPALSAIGMCEDDLHCCIRMSFSGRESKEELEFVCESLKKCVRWLEEMPTI